MLVRYKKALEKIAMGLISFMPQEKDVKKLMETIQRYEEQDEWALYLWKIEEEYVGAIGVYVEGMVATVHHLTVIPSHRGEGIGHQMLEELQGLEIYEDVRACDEAEPFFLKCTSVLNVVEN